MFHVMIVRVVVVQLKNKDKLLICPLRSTMSHRRIAQEAMDPNSIKSHRQQWNAGKRV